MADVSKLAAFTLVNAAAQRARQLMQGAQPLIRTTSKKPAAIAIREIYEGLIPVYMPGDLPFVEETGSEEPEEVGVEDSE